jgi:hypothetical protein
MTLLSRSLAFVSILAAGAAFAQSPAATSPTTDAPHAPVGPTWEEISPPGLTATSPLAVAVQPGNPDCMIVTSPGKAVFVTQDGGTTWSNPDHDFNYHDPSIPTHFITGVAFNPASPNQAIVVGLGGAYRSGNSGQNWTRCPDPTAGSSNSMAVSPNGTPVAAGLFGDLFVYDWSTNTWPIANTIMGQVQLHALDFDANDPSWLYITNASDILWVTPDFGTTLYKGGRGLPAYTESVACDPVIPGRAHVTVGAQLYRTTTGPTGGTWAPAGTGLPGTQILCLYHHPLHPEFIFAGTVDHGVFFSPDRGDTWHPVGQRGMRHGSVMNLVISEDDPRYLFAAAHAGSMAEGGFYRLRIRP